MWNHDRSNSTVSQSQSKKRKHNDISLSSNSRDKQTRKKVKIDRYAASRDARTIAVQASTTAFQHGELDVDKFVKSREYEIRALEQGLVSSKKALTKRAFQLVPKELRRRTASHNVKRVPKKLRERAKREMKEDNTPTVTAKQRKLSTHKRLRLETAKKLRVLGKKSDAILPNSRPVRIKTAKLAEPPQARARFRKRQINKSWLPTHLFHTKRARMTPPKEPLWRFALPMTPTAKSYRPTHHAASHSGAIAFDMSYISTIMLSGRYNSLLNVLQGLDQDKSIDRMRMAQKWRWIQGSLAQDVSIYHRETAQSLISPVTIIWCPSTTKTASWDELSITHGSLMMRVHPSAFLELWDELIKVSKIAKPAVTVQDLRYELGCIDLVGPGSTEALLATLSPSSKSVEDVWQHLEDMTNTTMLPPGTIIDMEVQDPRLCLKARSARARAGVSKTVSSVVERVSQWSLPVVGALFDSQKRASASSGMPSQKAINRRRTDAQPGCDPTVLAKDPRIPVLLHTVPDKSSRLSKWTLLLPWRCVLPIWYALMHIPLSTGVQPRFGGVVEVRNISLEYGLPWFPADYPTTRAGWQWELQERIKLEGDWKGRPRSKRINYDTLELGNAKGEIGLGWACDWEFLLRIDTPGTQATDAIYALLQNMSHTRWQNVSARQQSRTLMTVRVHVARGVPHACARVYRLPTNNERRKQWLALHPNNIAKSQARRCSKPTSHVPSHLQQEYLARSLLLPPQPGQPNWPACPGEEDLIGFITTGNLDLGAGRGTAIASLLVSRLSDETICIVRNSGQTFGRLASWSPA